MWQEAEGFVSRGSERCPCSGSLLKTPELSRSAFPCVPRAKAAAAVSWEAPSLPTPRDRLSSSENAGRIAGAAPAAGTGAAVGLSPARSQRKCPGRRLCSRFLNIWHK